VSIAVEEEIASLPALSKAELLKKWRERLKQTPPSHLNKPILVPLLAYRLQEQAFGGLKPAISDGFGNWLRASSEIQTDPQRQFHSPPESNPEHD
jgi:DUF2924 family protein